MATAAPWIQDAQRTAAWAASMTRGQPPGVTAATMSTEPEPRCESCARGEPCEGGCQGQGAPATARSAPGVGAITHRCDASPGGAPCPNCGGNIRRDHPAYQALQWGIMEANLRPWASPFERIATVNQAVVDAPARNEDAEWAALDSLGRKMQAIQTRLQEGEMASPGGLGWKDTEGAGDRARIPGLGASYSASGLASAPLAGPRALRSVLAAASQSPLKSTLLARHPRMRAGLKSSSGSVPGWGLPCRAILCGMSFGHLPRCAPGSRAQIRARRRMRRRSWGRPGAGWRQQPVRRVR
jgi:hypothetical protein